MKIKSYIKEIQYRLFFLFLTFFGNAVIFYFYKEQLIFLLGKSQSNFFPYFISTNLTEIFFVFIKITFSLAFYFTLPCFMLQTWFFLIPALYKYEYEISKKLLIASFFLFTVCTIGTLKLFLPYCWEFFSSFQLKSQENLVGIHMELKINNYLNFFLEILFSITFLFHFFIVFLFSMKLFPIKLFIKFRKVVYFFIFMLATLFSPPDIFSQLSIGGVLILFYEIFLFSSFLRIEYKKGE